MKKTIEHDGKLFVINEYLDGVCPGCRGWEAPITSAELVVMPGREQCYHGSGPRVVDRKTKYYRETWREFFSCPTCFTRFAVLYSNT